MPLPKLTWKRSKVFIKLLKNNKNERKGRVWQRGGVFSVGESMKRREKKRGRVFG